MFKLFITTITIITTKPVYKRDQKAILFLALLTLLRGKALHVVDLISRPSFFVSNKNFVSKSGQRRVGPRDYRATLTTPVPR
jgi:hypothetical protein